MLIKKSYPLFCLQLILIGFNLSFVNFYTTLYALENSYSENVSFSGEQKILDFDTAVRRALNQSLTLHLADYEIQARKGLKKQARLFPNPEFSYELESPGDISSRKGWSSREEIYALSQFVELGGKRCQRIKMASAQYYAALAGYEVSKLDLLNRLSKAFVSVVAAQEFVKLAYDQQAIAQQILQIIKAKLEAGKVSLIQQNKAEIAFSLTSLTLRKSLAEFKIAKNDLALLWASSCADFDFVIFPFYEISAPLSLEECLSDLCNQPEVVQSLHEYTAAYHNLRLEKSVRIPDVTLTLGYKYEDRDKGLVAGIAFPLPLLNRNQGNIKKAYYDVLKTGDQGKQLWLFLETKLSNSHLELMRSYQEVQDLKNNILRSSTQAFDLAQEGYREGKFEYLDVLDAQRTLFEVQERYIQSLVNYHNSRADIDYLNSQTD